MSQSNDSTARLKVFISYSRRDCDFADRLVSALEKHDIEILIDRRDLPTLMDWERELLDFIRQADTIVFIVSDASISSAACKWEVEQVRIHNKRLAPVVISDIARLQVPSEISKINYFYFIDELNFEKRCETLAIALKTDLAWLKDHTRLGDLARRWRMKNAPKDALMRGDDLAEARDWAARRPREAPPLSGDHLEYINASVQDERSARAKEQQSARTRQRMQLGLIALLALTLTGSIGWINQDVIEAAWNWHSKALPYMRAHVTPHVLTTDKELALKPGDVFRECRSDCPEMVAIKPGRYLMGSSPEDKQRFSNELPPQRITIAYPFSVSKYPVTFAEWDVCVSVKSCPNLDDGGLGRADRPVINVQWQEATTYAAWLSAMTGHTYRLLSDAEWEYVARAGTTTIFPWGDDIGRGNTNCNGCGSKWDNRTSAPVGSFKPNKFGLYDTNGNVFQWTTDCWVDNLHGIPLDGTPRTAGDCRKRVVRGGSFGYGTNLVRSASRNGIFTNSRDAGSGFRLARDLVALNERHSRTVAQARTDEAKAWQDEAAQPPSPGSSIRDCVDGCPHMIIVPAGSFVMGSAHDEKGRDEDEGPERTVSIPRPFAVGKHSVTFEEWDACVSDAGCGTNRFPHDRGWGRGSRPAIYISWVDAQEYVKWLSQKTNRAYRLLSEAEWEYAARAGSKTPYLWGSNPGSGNANCIGCGSQWDGRMTAPVGSFKPNAFGLHEMYGNIREWVQDQYFPSYDGAPSNGTPRTGEEGVGRVVRGASWYDQTNDLRAAYRRAEDPTLSDTRLGFRIARDLAQTVDKTARVEK